MAGPEQRRRDGFVMLEFLVAFTLLVLFLAGTFAALAVAIRADQRATFLTLGSILAKSRLAAAGIEFPLTPGTTGGTLPNGYRWQAEIRVHGRVEGGSGWSVSAYRVEVTVAETGEPGARTLSLAGVEIDREARP